MSVLQDPSAQAILDDLIRAYRDLVVRILSEDGSEELALARMKSRARDLHAVISAACRAGTQVRLYGAEPRGGPHIVRSIGPLQPDGVTFRYSCIAYSPELDSWCTLLSVRAIRFGGTPGHQGGPSIERAKGIKPRRSGAVNTH